ncbi:rhamnogalacturonan lyase [Pseudarthrobacter sp. J75]|uniref:rhamnogalacturonan lyase n=1 Tax=unclassified Pseudarthrobacter TaxID=2647000 RepID=UPI002E824388|nr:MULTISPECIES: rhamnogalacturonan lyase [unclassified Pseudarthrobacter]MEE2521897.1 rhamnogalacturonan lyase [Pseudarthrobacter sp. J47]MEE2528822.1 rhamnogalacturonan lyase [Pseudarthrobacter sp. J75]
MNPNRKSVRSLSVAAAAGVALTLGCLTTPASAVGPASPGSAKAPAAGVQLDHLDRGLVAAGTSEGVFLSWRLLGHEATGSSATGLTGTDFNVYRDGQKIAAVTDSTNYLDPDGTGESAYEVRAVVGGVELDKSDSATSWGGNFRDIPLTKPADGVTPAGEAYTYRANDASVGDVDGDGQYEFVVKWDPTNSKDVSQVGYTGATYVDTYKADGTLLHRIDLGVNIRSGAHYTQLLVNDFDGDGRVELMFKTAPGTKSISYNADGSVAGESFITLLQEDLDAGYSNSDDYRMSAADYYQHVVEMFLGWSEHPEVASGNWPATLEEAFGQAARYQYPLSRTDAEQLADYFIDEYAPGRSARNNLRAFEGFVLDGPEYLTVFEGTTGKELKTVAYEPGRHDDGLMWGDYAMGRIEPGNRVDRFLAGVAYLDGKTPAAVFARGYYTRTTLASYTWDGTNLSPVWNVDSGWTPMSNPFNDSPHGVDGTDPVFGKLTTQGFHSLSAADVDGDGRQEIVYGSATIDDDGSLLYSSFDTMPAQSATPGQQARLGHGDAMHVADIDPDRPGKEIFTVHEGGTWAPYGYAMRDAATGEVLFGEYSGKDTGRGMIGDVDPDVRGIENWAMGMQSASGEKISPTGSGTNMSIKWAADMTTQLVNGSRDQTPTIDDWKRGRLLTATGTLTNNGTKGTPSLVADVVGDWREEMLVRTADSSALRMYLSTEVTSHKLYTLMHDPQYRAEVARQNTSYNQPAYTDFYLASDMDFGNVPLRAAWTPGSVRALQQVLDGLVESGEVSGQVAAQLTASAQQATKAVDDGDSAKAGQAVQRFTDFLGQQKRADQVSDRARTVLEYHAGNILRAFQG